MSLDPAQTRAARTRDWAVGIVLVDVEDRLVPVRCTYSVLPLDRAVSVRDVKLRGVATPRRYCI